MIKYSKQNGIITPHGIKRYDDSLEIIKVPNIAVGVFSRHLFYDIVEKFSTKKVGYISLASFEKPVYILDYKGKEITLFLAGVSGPHIVADMEELNVNGVDTFIIFGNCGVLDSSIEDCSIIIPDKAYRDEGTSYHYVEESEYLDLSNKYENLFINILKENDYSYVKGSTWTTDAIYRETRDKFNYYKEKGCVCVEMEGASIAAVSKRNNYNYFTFYYAGDNLDAVDWEPRSINGLTAFDKKKKVPLLALELAYKISK